jgi:PIN domain nuclease of toxin-antitoxin system
VAIKGILLDTHAWIWLRAGTLKTADADLDRIRQAAENHNWFVCSFSLTEIAHSFKRKRLQFDKPLLSWFRDALLPPGPQIISITPELAATTAQLPDSFHGDPGDRFLAATAILEDLVIVTHDKVLLRYAKQGLFQAIKVDEVKVKHAR